MIWRLKIVVLVKLVGISMLLCWVAPDKAVGQSQFRRSQTLSQMYHAPWTVRQGAPANPLALAQTRDGYLWVAADDGLWRFDGSSFEHYSAESGDEMPGGTVQSLLSTPDGGLWVGFPGGSINYLKGGHNTRYGPKEGVPSGNVIHLALSPDGTVWAACARGLMRFAKARWERIGREWSYPQEHAENVHFDRRGTLWVGSGKQLLYLPLGEHSFRVAINAEEGDGSYGIAEAPNGTIWVALHDSSVLRAVTRPDGELLRTGPVVHGVKTVNPYFASDGSLWLPTDDKGLFRIPATAVQSENPSNWLKHAEHLTTSEGLTGGGLSETLEDREGSLWFTSNHGLDQFRHTVLNNVAVPDAFNRVAPVSDGAGGVFAASTDASVLHVLGDGHSQLLHPKLDVVCAYRDSRGIVWLGGGGLWKNAGDGFVTVPLPAGIDPSVHKVAALTTDGHGDLWAYFLQRGVFRLHAGVWVQSPLFAQSSLDGAPVEMKDGRGRVWFGLRRNQVKVFDGNALTSYGPESGVDVDFVTSLCTRGDHLWIGGERGIEYLKQKRFYHLTLTGVAPAGVSGIFETQAGDLWLNEASGVVHIAKAEIQHAQSDPSYAAQATRYNYLDGLVGSARQVRPTPSVVEGTDGRLWFGTRAGLAWLDPTRLTINSAQPSIFISSVLADGKIFRSPGNLRLPPHTQSLQVNYTAVSLAIPERIRFKYKLEGFDKDWQDAGTRRQAFYSALPPGHYRFRVVSCNQDGIWNKHDAAFGFDIPPGFFQGIWFKALCVGVAFILLALLYRLRVRVLTQRVKSRLYERLAERERIARDLHDTFFQGIQGLILRFNTGTAQLPREEPARAIFEEALKESDRVMLEGRELILDLRTGSAGAGSLSSALAETGSELRNARDLAFQVIVHGEQRALHPVVFEEIYRICREALANAFRHSQGTSVEAELNYGNSELRVRIRDDGIGLPVDVLLRGELDGHWGLPGMRERARKVGGQMDLWSRKGAGTEIEVRVPGPVAYKTENTKPVSGLFGGFWERDTQPYD